jgi:hypothetical protein
MDENEEQDSKEEPGTNYQVLFVLGITFLGVGAALMVTNPGMVGLMVMGIIFMAVGLANRDKWSSQ